MTGSVLDLVRTGVERRYGRTTWTALVGGPERLVARPGDRPDPDSPAPLVPDTPSEALACWLGRQAVALLARERPELFQGDRELRSFLFGLSGRTAAGGPGEVETVPLAVEVRPAVDSDLLVRVDGDGACCALVEGLIAGGADHYGERARIELLKCRRRGDNRCVIRVGFDVAGPEVDFRFAPLSAPEPVGRRVRVV